MQASSAPSRLAAVTTCRATTLLFVVASCADTERAESHAPARDRDLQQIVDLEWEARLKRNPLFATGIGRHDYGNRLPRVDPESLRSACEEDRRLLARLESIDGVQGDDRITHAMLLREIGERIADYEYGAWQMPFTADSGFHTEVAQMPRNCRFHSEADYEAYLTRLAEIPRYFREQEANLRSGLESGMTVPRACLAGYDGTMQAHVVSEAPESVFYAPFKNFPAGVPQGQRAELTQRGTEVIQQAAVPAYRALLEFFTNEYLPGARTSLGASQLPRGEAYYAHLVRHFTTLDVTPEEVHQRGLGEVARIRSEMQTVIENVDFEGSFADFLSFLRTDERFYPRSAEQLLAAASRLAKRADAALPRFFGNLPRLPYGVEPVPAHIAPKYTAGRYVRATPGSGEPGWYWVNTTKLESRPLYALPALTLHEAVPGHHLQIALAAELEGLPEFRKQGYIGAYGEGWALYCEWLGREMDIYDTPYDEFGRLTYEMWRACRLVVDTGLHAFGWERQQAIDYLTTNTALSLHECTTEVDRYISWPGQALSYKMGELAIRELRAEYEAKLGRDFDLREFHDALLGSGSVPLELLDDVIENAK